MICLRLHEIIAPRQTKRSIYETSGATWRCDLFRSLLLEYLFGCIRKLTCFRQRTRGCYGRGGAARLHADAQWIEFVCWRVSASLRSPAFGCLVFSFVNVVKSLRHHHNETTRWIKQTTPPPHTHTLTRERQWCGGRGEWECAGNSSLLPLYVLNKSFVNIQKRFSCIFCILSVFISIIWRCSCCVLACALRSYARSYIQQDPYIRLVRLFIFRFLFCFVQHAPSVKQMWPYVRANWK